MLSMFQFFTLPSGSPNLAVPLYQITFLIRWIVYSSVTPQLDIISSDLIIILIGVYVWSIPIISYVT